VGVPELQGAPRFGAWLSACTGPRPCSGRCCLTGTACPVGSSNSRGACLGIASGSAAAGTDGKGWIWGGCCTCGAVGPIDSSNSGSGSRFGCRGATGARGSSENSREKCGGGLDSVLAKSCVGLKKSSTEAPRPAFFAKPPRDAPGFCSMSASSIAAAGGCTTICGCSGPLPRSTAPPCRGCCTPAGILGWIL